MYVSDNEWGTKYKNFKKIELKCKCGKCSGYGNGIASTLLDALQYLRNKYNTSIIITSGYRCSNHNINVGGSKNSKHMTGQACDFYFANGYLNSESKRKEVVKVIKTLPNYRYTYCNINGSNPNMGNVIHMDFTINKTIKCKLKSGVWCRLNGFGFKYPKYKVIPKNTCVEVLEKNVGASNGYKWDKIKWNNKTLYLPNKWSTYI